MIDRRHDLPIAQQAKGLRISRGSRIPPDTYPIWADALGIDTRAFVKTLMRFYDPVTHEILFADLIAPETA